MIEVLKYIRGYVRIRVGGFSPERFMNLCSNKGILLWDIVRDGEVYYMCINLKGFWQLRPIVKKTKTRVAVLERYGLPFFIPKIFARKVFVAGIFLAVGFWIWSSFFIWDIELEGNYRITDDIFQSFLKSNQVTTGMTKESLDIETLEKEIRRSFPVITWASAKLTGTKLQISIKENDAPIITDEQSVTTGTDLAAEYAGTIVSIIVRSGVPKVLIGDVVEEGSILVEGKIPIYNEDKTIREYHYVDADADIVLEHTRSFRASLPFDYVKQVYTGRERKNYYLRLGSNELKISIEKPYLVYDSLIKESRSVVFEKLSVPIFLGSITYREYQNVEKVYTLDEAEAILKQKLFVFLATLEEKGVQIIEKNVKIDTNSNLWVIEGDFLVHELIGKSLETVKPEIGDVSADE